MEAQPSPMSCDESIIYLSSKDLKSSSRRSEVESSMSKEEPPSLFFLHLLIDRWSAYLTDSPLLNPSTRQPEIGEALSFEVG